MPTLTPRVRKPRGPGKLTPAHLDYLRLRQSGQTQKDAARAANCSIAKAKRAEKHPDGIKFLAETAANARIQTGYGLVEAVAEVDRAIQFAYEQENPNAIAKLLEHKSKLYGLLIEKVNIQTSFIDLAGALEAAKQRVLKCIHPLDAERNRGIPPSTVPLSLPETLPYNTNVATGPLADGADLNTVLLREQAPQMAHGASSTSARMDSERHATASDAEGSPTSE